MIFLYHIIFKGFATNMTYHWWICHSLDWSNVKLSFLPLFILCPLVGTHCAAQTERVVSLILLSGGVSFPWEICLFSSFIYYIIYINMSSCISFVFLVQPNATLFILYQFSPALSIGSSYLASRTHSYIHIASFLF